MINADTDIFYISTQNLTLRPDCKEKIIANYDLFDIEAGRKLEQKSLWFGLNAHLCSKSAQGGGKKSRLSS